MPGKQKGRRLSETQVISLSAEDAYQDLLDFFELNGVPTTTTTIAATLRRLCGIICPCPPSALVRMALQSLSFISQSTDALREQVETVLEDMIICGDLLELAHIAISGGENHLNWLYCTPPSYVRRGNRIHIFGIAVDDARFIPGELRSYEQREGALRFIDADAEPGLVDQLSSMGLRKVHSDTWMATVSQCPAKDFVGRLTRKLESMGTPGDLPDMSLLLPIVSTHLSYRSRWVQPSNESGQFIARVPQPYGSPLWYFCYLKEGIVQRSLLLPLKDSTERASDTAWRLQLALDANGGNPGTYVIRQNPDGAGVTIHLDFPLPLPARRRLLVLGARRIEDHPYKFWLPTAELATEKRFLRESYWLEERLEEK